MHSQPTISCVSERDAYLDLDDRGLLAQSEVDTYRASGPGGQKRNKTDSAVRLRHRPTRLMVVAVESRSQHENRDRALKRLRQAIALHVRASIDAAQYKPGSAVSRCLNHGRATPTRRLRPGLRIGRRDRCYNHAVAEILDLFLACECQASSTARKLGVSTANLVAFFRRDVKLVARVNQMRASVGIKPLR